MGVFRAGVTQLVECNLAKVDVAGSNPVSRSIPELFRPSYVSDLDGNAYIPVVVSPVGSLLAPGNRGSYPVPYRLAASSTIPDRRRGGRGCTRTHMGAPDPARPPRSKNRITHLTVMVGGFGLLIPDRP